MMDHLVVCGSAECLFKDLEALGEFFDLKNEITRPSIAVVNHTALYYPYNFEMWVSHHPEIFEALQEFVKPCAFSTYSDIKYPGVNVVHRFPGFICNDSGLLAVKIGIEIGHRKIILAGIPLDNSPKFYAPSEPTQWAADNLQEAWRKEVPGFNDRVKSMSGNTRRILGAPTKEWLDGPARTLY